MVICARCFAQELPIGPGGSSKTPWLQVEQLEQMPYLSKVMLQSSKSTAEVRVLGSFATYSAILQRIQVEASDNIGLVFVTHEVHGETWARTPLWSNGHSRYCQCASCS